MKIWKLFIFKTTELSEDSTHLFILDQSAVDLCDFLGADNLKKEQSRQKIRTIQYLHIEALVLEGDHECGMFDDESLAHILQESFLTIDRVIAASLEMVLKSSKAILIH